MKKIYITLILASALLFSACEDWVNDVEPLIDRVEDEYLTDESQVPFLINGVEGAFAQAQGYISVDAEGFSDALVFDTDNPSATYTGSYGMIDEGTILTDNTEIESNWQYIGELRKLADNLLERCQKITFVDEDLQKEAAFVGNFYGGVARYYYAIYYALDGTTTSGGCIDAGPFIAGPQIMEYAMEKFQAALDNASSAYETRIVNSVMARGYLFMGNYTEAATYAAAGMQEGDNPFQALYSEIDNNYYYYFAGLGRPQWTVNPRYKAYLNSDPTEAGRISLDSTKGTSGKYHYIQTKYNHTYDPLNFMSWQENNLMLAELALRGFGSGDADALVNAVRSSHGVSQLASVVDLEGIYVERDKELFVTGVRYVDQKRFNHWHLPTTAGYDLFFPIPESEVNANPNF